MAQEYEQLLLKNQLCFPMYACGRKIVAAYTPYLKPLGLTYTQYVVFMVLWEKGELTVTDLGKALSLDSGTLTPVLKKLEANGYVKRRRSSDDERSVLASPTDKGWDLQEKLSSVPQEIGSCVKLTPEEARLLYGLLYKIIDGFENS